MPKPKKTAKNFQKFSLFPLIFVALTSVFLYSVLGVFLQKSQSSVDPMSLNGSYDSKETQGEFYGKKTVSSVVSDSGKSQFVLGVTDKPKRIEVDLSTQRLYAFEGDEKVYDFLISSGKWGRTPTGTFKIWGKFRYTKMSGGSKQLNTYYYLPNVPFVMFFSNNEIAASRGFSLHGTYWHENFGHPMSHGCINMRTEEAEQIFNWSAPNIGDLKSGKATAEDPGTEVIIYGVAPRE
jgi:hypothetical protein